MLPRKTWKGICVHFGSLIRKFTYNWRLLHSLIVQFLYPCSDEFYSFTGYWSQRGCIQNKKESSKGIIVCDCNHLTHFAVLLSPGVKLGARHVLALQVIGYIGIVVSLAAMVITVLFLTCLRY